MKNFKLNILKPLTRDEMKQIHGGKDLHFQCACQTSGLEWGCISVDGCESTGDSVCPNDYRCTTV